MYKSTPFKNIISRLLFISALLFLFTSLDLEAKTINGRVIDLYSSKGIPYVFVEVETPDNGNRSVKLSDSLGNFSFDNFRYDKFIISTTRFGYVDITVGPFNLSNRDSLRVTIQLEPAPIELEEVEITADYLDLLLDRRGFYKRKEIGRGKYYTRDDFKYRFFPDAADMLQMIPGIGVKEMLPGTEDISSEGDGVKVFAYRNRRGLNQVPPMSIFLDGAPVNADYLLMLNPDDISALEVYKSWLTTPAEFSQTGTAGAILIWTGDNFSILNRNK